MTDSTNDITGAPTERAVPGTLYLTPDGTAYRLRSYTLDWKADPFTGEENVPTFSVFLPNGACSSSIGDLPEGTVVIWSPPAQA